MKFLYYFVLSLTFSFCVEAQKPLPENINPDEKYLVEAKVFIKDIYGEKLKVPRLVLIDQPNFGSHFEHVDTNLFNKEELILIREQIKSPKIKSWNECLKPTKKFISRDSINNIFKTDHLRLYNGWEYFRRYLGSEINSISAPIFLRDYQYCLFYSDYVCDFKCGNGMLKLYRRINNHWIKVSLLSSWVS